MIDDTVTFSLQTQMPAELLLIDDEPFNLEILSDYLSDAGYKSKCYENPVDAWKHLDANPNYKCILLDRMMPDMDGLDLLKKIKQDPRFEHVPVIMQTADGSHDSLCAGMRSGAFYYLIKPFSKDLLLTVVEAALVDYNRYVLLQDHLKQSSEAFKLMNEAVFSLQSLKQADILAAMLAKCCHNPNRVVLGLSELLINAIEHGNLEIDFDKKTELLSNGNWQEYINKKLISNPYSQRKVIVSMKKIESEFENKIEFIIKDEGDGFNWQALEDRVSERLMQSHGRGILIAKNMSFDELNFIGSGNQVRACVKYPKNNQDIRESNEHIYSREKSRSYSNSDS